MERKSIPSVSVTYARNGASTKAITSAGASGFRNDTERLEKLFDLYTKMTTEAAKSAPAKKVAKGKTA